MSKKLSYGIDFGTTNSTIAVVDNNNQILQLPVDSHSDNQSVMRSVIFVDKNGSYQYGAQAVKSYIQSVAINKGASKRVVETGKKLKLTAPASATSGFKPDVIVDEVLEIEEADSGRLFQGIKSILSSTTVKKVNIYGEIIAVEELVGRFLKEMKTRADFITGKNINSAVVGRPIEYVGGNNQQAIMKMEKALEIAGFTDWQFEFEPIGAALEYGVKSTEQELILVFDFGGGTLDVSVVSYPANKVYSTVGLPIGGDHLNSILFDKYIAPYFGKNNTYGDKNLPIPRHIFYYLKDWFKITLLKNDGFFESLESFSYKSSNPQAIVALESLIKNNLGFSVYEEIERVKKRISTSNVDKYKYSNQDIDIHELITRSNFESLIEDDLVNIDKCIELALSKANLNQTDITSVITTGGSSLIPVVRQLMVDKFGSHKLAASDTFTSVASGLAIKASTIYR